MSELSRRLMLQGIAVGTGALTAAGSRAAPTDDGRAAGYDVAPAQGVTYVAHRAADPVRFTFPLDTAPIKATSGGWAREVTTRQLPLATGIAGAHLFMNPGGSREMHWHTTSDEWAYVLAGHCQTTVLSPGGDTEIANLRPGDLWYFPRGHAHAIQTLGVEPCHAILAFNDGLYSEHGTFGISDWMSQLDPVILAQTLGVPAADLATLPKGETYINQGPILALDGPEAARADAWGQERTHRFALRSAPAYRDLPGGTLHVASSLEFPVASAMTTAITRLQPGALHEPHWHPNADEWLYLAAGETRVTLFGPDKHIATAQMTAGDCAYVPAGWGHSVGNTGVQPCEQIAVLTAARYEESSLSAWLAAAPPHLLLNNLGITDAFQAALPHRKVDIAASR